MMPLDFLSRRSALQLGAAQLGLWLAAGCTSHLIRPQSPDTDARAEDESSVRLVGDLAGTTNLVWLKLEGVGLVTGLANTGSDPPPSGLRQRLMGEMQSHDVKNPNQVLASPTTSMVLVVGFLPPGAQKGDEFDVAVTLPTGSETTSLKGGWLMQTRLRQTAILDGAVTTGHISGLAGGNVLVQAVFDAGNDEKLQKRGRVLGGGVSQLSRPLGLRVHGEGQSVMTTSLIGAAVNGRFHTFERGIKKGVANPKDDRYIELHVHPRYKHNVARYVRVIANIPLRETPVERAARLDLLSRMLSQPTTAALAALRLEAIGNDAVKTLREALTSNDVEVRFYAAEALAYLDEADATPILAETCRSEPALRWHALTALSAMDHIGAYEVLGELLNEPSAETRYGAFRAMRARNPSDPQIKGERLGDQFSYHLVTSFSDPMIHFSRHRRPELVLFGHDVRMVPPAALYAGKEIIIKGIGPDRIKLSRFSPNKDDRHEEVGTQVDEVIRAIVKLGGTYPDVMQAIQDAKRTGYLSARVAVDAVPQPDRQFVRHDEFDSAEESEGKSKLRAANPLPELFQNPHSEGSEANEKRRTTADEEDQEDKPKKGFLGRMTGWFHDE